MGLYITVESLIAKYGEREIKTLSNIGVNSGSTTTFEDRVNAVINEVEAAIANPALIRYLNDGSPNPLLTNPTIKRYIHAIVRYDLDQQDPREKVIMDYKEAIKWFESVSSGKINLGLSAEGTKINPVESSISVSNETGSFTTERLESYTDNGQIDYSRGHIGGLRRGLRGRRDVY